METCNDAGSLGKQKISHLSFLVALLQSIGFEPDPSCPSGPSEVQDLVDFLGAGRAKGTTVTITCEHSKKTFTLRLPEKEEPCNCLAVDENEGQPLGMSGENADDTGLKGLFDALLKHLRSEFIRETKRLKGTFELDSISLTSIFPNFHNISIESETFTEYNYETNEMNRTYTVKRIEVPRQSTNKIKRCPSAPPPTRPEGRKNSIGSKPNKFEPKVSPTPIYLKPGKFKVPTLPKSPSLSVKSDTVKASTLIKSPIPASTLNSKSPNKETKLKSLGTALKNSTVAIRRSFGFTAQNKYEPSIKATTSRRNSTPMPTRGSLMNPTYNVDPLPLENYRTTSTDRCSYGKIPIASSAGTVRAKTGVIPKLNFD